MSISHNSGAIHAALSIATFHLRQLLRDAASESVSTRKDLLRSARRMGSKTFDPEKLDLSGAITQILGSKEQLFGSNPDPKLVQSIYTLRHERNDHSHGRHRYCRLTTIATLVKIRISLEEIVPNANLDDISALISEVDKPEVKIIERGPVMISGSADVTMPNVIEITQLNVSGSGDLFITVNGAKEPIIGKISKSGSGNIVVRPFR